MGQKRGKKNNKNKKPKKSLFSTFLSQKHSFWKGLVPPLSLWYYRSNLRFLRKMKYLIMGYATADKCDQPIPQIADKWHSCFLHLYLNNNISPNILLKWLQSITSKASVVTLSLLLRISDLFICRWIYYLHSCLVFFIFFFHPVFLSLSWQPWQRLETLQPFPYFNREH